SRATLLLHHLSVAIYVSHTVSPLIPTLSLHDALPISRQPRGSVQAVPLPHHHELHRGVPEGVEPGQGHRPDQGAAGQAGDLAHRRRTLPEPMSDARQLDRLRWRCRRGMLELDLLLERFVDRELARLGADEQRALERLLDLPDDELLDYCYRRPRPADPALA